MVLEHEGESFCGSSKSGSLFSPKCNEAYIQISVSPASELDGKKRQVPVPIQS